MARDVEDLDAEREIHRIDVFERWREKWKMCEEKEAGERDERGSHRGGMLVRYVARSENLGTRFRRAA